jgi:hypothetical protein
LLVRVNHSNEYGTPIVRVVIDVEASKVATTNNSDANLVCHGSIEAKRRQIPKLGAGRPTHVLP